MKLENQKYPWERDRKFLGPPNMLIKNRQFDISLSLSLSLSLSQSTQIKEFETIGITVDLNVRRK
jgi:hypothetical protein